MMRSTYDTFKMMVKDKTFDEKTCDTITAVLLKECTDNHDPKTVKKAIKLLEKHRPSLAKYVKSGL